MSSTIADGQDYLEYMKQVHAKFYKGLHIIFPDQLAETVFKDFIINNMSVEELL